MCAENIFVKLYEYQSSSLNLTHGFDDEEN